MKLRIPYLLAAVVTTASLFNLADTRGLNAAPLVSLTTISGHSLDLAAPEGKTRLVTFWSPDCPISERNIPALTQIHEQFAGQAFELVAVAMPYSKETEIDKYIQKNEIGFPVAFDHSGETSDAFTDVRFTPTTFLIDGNSNIVWKHVGRMKAEEASARINQALQPQHLANR